MYLQVSWIQFQATDLDFPLSMLKVPVVLSLSAEKNHNAKMSLPLLFNQWFSYFVPFLEVGRQAVVLLSARRLLRTADRWRCLGRWQRWARPGVDRDCPVLRISVAATVLNASPSASHWDSHPVPQADLSASSWHEHVGAWRGPVAGSGSRS